MHRTLGFAHSDLGLRYVQSIVGETGAKTKWNTFWRYFLRTWTKRCDMSLWNVSEMQRNNVVMTNRTDNPLETYNSDFAARIGASQPGLLAFIKPAKEEAAAYVRLVDDIKRRHQSPTTHAR
ncbi:hypothetical protein PHMEG_00033432 [Phytophthora megakarya]|uniref:Uncharacterized protein n=1 Tax=Phytophthora megakarya TaxID=4795 RepID=A0A225UTL0_9STRA|nr:hypothetical protein PHMEG_00033432 [Phytophthora megakarya]